MVMVKENVEGRMRRREERIRRIEGYMMISMESGGEWILDR